MASTRKILKGTLDRNGDGKVLDDVGRGAAWLIAFGILAVVVVAIWGAYTHRSTHTTVVTDKERVCSGGTDGNSSCKYLVFTESGTYKVSDSIIAFRWDSSDVYGRIKRCHRYEVTSFGWRSGFQSMYPNITSVKDLGRVDGCEP